MDAQVKSLTLAHSPDSDDAFMFYALAKRMVVSDRFEFRHILSDIQTLNQAAIEAKYDVTAISVHAYPYVARDYSLLNVGASMGDGYGPILVSKHPYQLDDLSGKTVGIPGALTTAALVLRLALPGLRTNEIAFDQILDSVIKGHVDAGLLIHEGQITYQKLGLHKVIDLGEWWKSETGLPLPLGANAIKKSLGTEDMNHVADLLRVSIKYAMENRALAVEYAADFGRDLSDSEVDRFVGMYVNEYTLDWGDIGRKSVTELLDRGANAGIIPNFEPVDFVG